MSTSPTKRPPILRRTTSVNQNEQAIKILAANLRESRIKKNEIEAIFNQKESLFLVRYILTKNTRTLDDLCILKVFLSSLEKFVTLIRSHNSATHDDRSEEIISKVSLGIKIHTESANTMLFRVGDTGNKFYIILRGSVTVLIPQEKEMRLSKDQYIAHLRMLYQNKEDYLISKAIDKNKDIFDVDMNKIKCQRLQGQNLQLDQYLKKLKGEQIKQNNFNPLITIFCYHNIITLAEGNFFGEVAIENDDSLRTASIFVNEKTTFGTLDSTSYKSSIRVVQQKIKREHTLFILSFGLFGEMGYQFFVTKLWNYFTFKYYKQGDFLFKENEDRKKIYFLFSGELKLHCELGKNRIKSIIEYLKGKRVKVIDEDSKKREVINITNIKERDIFSVDECNIGKKYFCNCEVVSKYIAVFAIEIKILEKLTNKFPDIKTCYTCISNKKKKIMRNRLKEVFGSKKKSMISSFREQTNDFLNDIRKEQYLERKNHLRKKFDVKQHEVLVDNNFSLTTIAQDTKLFKNINQNTFDSSNNNQNLTIPYLPNITKSSNFTIASSPVSPSTNFQSKSKIKIKITTNEKKDIRNLKNSFSINEPSFSNSNLSSCPVSLMVKYSKRGEKIKNKIKEAVKHNIILAKGIQSPEMTSQFAQTSPNTANHSIDKDSKSGFQVTVLDCLEYDTNSRKNSLLRPYSHRPAVRKKGNNSLKKKYFLPLNYLPKPKPMKISLRKKKV